MQIETMKYPSAYFLTLTYDDEHLDNLDSVIGLSPINKLHYQKFIRELRREHEIRYFGVHEYGSQTLRKHYHLIIWMSNPNDELKLSEVQSLWKYGHVMKDNLNNARIHYVTKYLNKPFRKFNNNLDEIENIEDDFDRKLEYQNYFLQMNTKNFMSLKPAIGANLLDDVDICNYIIETTLETCIYPKLVINCIEFPLPRYYIKKLFTPDERQSIYFQNLEKKQKNEMNEAKKLDLTLVQLYRIKQRKDELNLNRLLSKNPYECI